MFINSRQLKWSKNLSFYKFFKFALNFLEIQHSTQPNPWKIEKNSTQPYPTRGLTQPMDNSDWASLGRHLKKMTQLHSTAKQCFVYHGALYKFDYDYYYNYHY